MDRYLLVTLGSLEGRTFPIVDTDDRYHRTSCYATSWAEGEQLCEYLNRGARDLSYWEQTAADLESVPRRGLVSGEDIWEQLRAEAVANATEASQNDADHPGWGS